MLLKFWQTHSVFFKTFAIAFAFIFLLLAFAPPFNYDAHAVALLDDGIFMIIIAFLAACGITITASSSQSAIEWVEDAVNTFCTNASKTWETIKSGFSFGVNKLGEILTNNAVLDFLSEFVNWVRTEYGFADNTDTELVSSSVYPEIDWPYPYLYKSTFPVLDSSLITGTDYASGYYIGTRGNYINRVWNPSNQCYLMYFNGTLMLFSFIYGTTVNAKLSGSNITLTADLTFTLNGQTMYYKYSAAWGAPTTWGNLSSFTSADSASWPQTAQSFIPYLWEYLDAVPEAPSYVTAGVGTMDIPVEGTDYDDDDGAIIGGFGTLGDSLQEILRRIREWLESQSPANTVDPTLEVAPEADIAEEMDTGLLSMDNWPAIIPPLSLHDFSFNSIWHYVTDWISSFSGTLATIMGITFALPAIPILYAVVVISLALWLLRRASS